MVLAFKQSKMDPLKEQLDSKKRRTSLKKVQFSSMIMKQGTMREDSPNSSFAKQAGERNSIIDQISMSPQQRKTLVASQILQLTPEEEDPFDKNKIKEIMKTLPDYEVDPKDIEELVARV